MLSHNDVPLGAILYSKRLGRNGIQKKIIITKAPDVESYLSYRQVSPKTGKPIGKEVREYLYRLSQFYTTEARGKRELKTRDMVDLKAWEEWRNQAMVPGKTGMGNTPMECLTKEGIRVRELLTEFLGIAPKYQAASYKHFYFKWDVLNAGFRADNAAIVGDLLTDEGHTVKVEQTDLYLRIVFEHVTPIPKKERSRSRGREAIEIPRYSVQ